jgi:magnesium-transporting ATPase (P-type)
VFAFALPLNALQILFVNFFSDSLPAVAFAFERDDDAAKSPLRGAYATIFDNQFKFLVFILGTVSSVLLFVLYACLLYNGVAIQIAQTFIFASFATYSLLLAFSLRKFNVSIFRYNPFENKVLTLGVFIGLLLTALAVYWAPLGGLLGTVPLSGSWLIGLMGVWTVALGAIEGTKFLFYRRVLQP